jgi:branched-chain amino acid transport system permease protein
MGVLEYLAIGYIDPLIGSGFGSIFPFLIMIVILMFRPYGLFGLRRIERI